MKLYNGCSKDLQRVRPMRVLLVCLTVMCGAGSAWAQTFTLSGTVRDASSQETLPNATVMIKGTDRGAATNADGYFVLVNVPGDSLVLRVTYLGYVPREIAVEPRTQNGPLDVLLEVFTPEMEEVMVTAERYQIVKMAESVSQITISPKDLAVLPSVGEVDIFRSLQLLPGISGTNEGSSGLFVRGGTPDQNLVILDGMTVYHVDHFFGFFSAFNADAIKDVQVYKGGFSASYGGRTSSVIDLSGKTGDVNNYRLGAGLNLLSGNMVAEVPLGGKGAFLLSARRSYTDVLQTGLYNSIYETLTGGEETDETTTQPAGGPGGGGFGGRGGALGGGFRNAQLATVQPDFYFYDLNAKLTLLPTKQDVVAVSFYNGQDHLDKSRFQQRLVGPQDNQNTLINNDLEDLTDWGNIGVSGKWSRQWHPRFYSNALVAYSQYFSEYNRNTFIERVDTNTDTTAFTRSTGSLEDNKVEDFSFRLDNEWQAAPQHKINFGLQATRSDVTFDFVRDDTLTILNRDQQATQLALYAEDVWQVRPRVSITAGLRTIYYDQTEETYIEPRLAFSLGLTDRIKLKGAYGQFNQFVSRIVNENVTEGARDFWLLADGEGVQVEGSTHYILGASYETPTWLFDTEAYYKDLEGLSEFSLRFQRNRNGEAVNQLFFGGTGVSKGMEFLVQKKNGTHTGWLSYTLAQVEHTFVDLNDGVAFPALHDQRHELKAVYALNLGDWQFSSTWTYGSGKPYTAPASEYTLTLLDGAQQSYIHVSDKNSERLPAYHRLDAAIHYKTSIGQSKLDLGFSVFNLYNRVNVWYKEFDLSESPMVTTDVTFLGITPNLSIRVDI